MYMPRGMPEGQRTRIISRFYTAADQHCMTFYHLIYKTDVGEKIVFFCTVEPTANVAACLFFCCRAGTP